MTTRISAVRRSYLPSCTVQGEEFTVLRLTRRVQSVAQLCVVVKVLVLSVNYVQRLVHREVLGHLLNK